MNLNFEWLKAYLTGKLRPFHERDPQRSGFTPWTLTENDVNKAKDSVEQESAFTGEKVPEDFDQRVEVAKAMANGKKGGEGGN